MTKIESLQKNDLVTAIKLAKFYEKYLPDFRIEERISFKKLQAELYIIKMEYHLAKEAANDGLNQTKKLSHPNINMAELLNLRGYSYDNLGNSEPAIQDYLSALEIAESLDDDKVVIISLINLGAIDYGNERFQRSLILLNEALLLAQKLKDDKSLGLVYFELGSLYSHFQLESKVQEFYENAKTYFIKANESYLVTRAIQNIAITHAKSKEYLSAISLYEEMIIKAKKNGVFFNLSNMYSKLAQAYLNKPLSDPNTAYKYIISAEKYLDLVKEPSSEILIGINKADILNHLERYKEAMNAINYAEEMLSEQDEHIRTYSYQEILRIKSEIFYNQGFYQEAYQAQNQYHENVLEINNRNNFYALEGMRIEYESKQHEIQAKALEKKRLIQLQALKEVNESYQERTFYIIICIFTMLSLVWFYSVNLKNRKKLLDSRGSDHLTDIPNRQSILLAGSSAYNQAIANEFNVMLIKVDNFTNINQVKGYEIGNSILIEISLIILNIIGENALCGRYSSNEFIVFLPNTSAVKAESVANGIHNTIYRKSWDKYGLKVVSVSIGMSNNDFSVESYESLIKTTKTLKQQAVILGGNTVCIS
ncbi:diguanylate cyclase [Pseudocolwellia sp. AS88]|uniref:diguanylate cyclase domain-containing protein n=1 Tax=Pseudocolwellia sp. AS88 TaxID=3063958 RepID=UPI0026F2D6D1|nr:diguanylate cyclase [Pseudocolwellia sp. AS88]MDO7083800.1 diguanylate cyclase [Pseudocolwellia sp. AS88]